MKIDVHEIEAEGPRDFVLAQLETWKALAGLRSAPAAESARDQEAVKEETANAAQRKLFGIDAAQQAVTLRATLRGRRRNADAALLILYAYCIWLGMESGIEAKRLYASLAASGYRPKRVDRALRPHLAAGLIRRGGRHKSETYVLTSSGLQRAAAWAQHLWAQHLSRNS